MADKNLSSLIREAKSTPVRRSASSPSLSSLIRAAATEQPTEEITTHEREENLINPSVEGLKGAPVSVDDDDIDSRIKPPSKVATGTEAHHIRTSRGEEVGFYQIPQGGIFNNSTLKS